MDNLKSESIDDARDHHQISPAKIAAHHRWAGHRYSVHLAGQHRRGCRRPAGNEDQVDIETAFFEQPGLFGNPNRRKRACLRAVADIHSFEFFLGLGRPDICE